MSPPFTSKYLKGSQLSLSSSLHTNFETEILSTEAEILCQLEFGASNTVTVILYLLPFLLKLVCATAAFYKQHINEVLKMNFKNKAL